MSRSLHVSIAAIALALVGACGSASSEGSVANIPAGMFEVKPVAASSAKPSNAPAANLSVAQGKFFSYALPQGWHLGEDGQFALTQAAPDNKALTIMVGNAGLFPNYPPAQFVQEKFAAMQPQNLRIGEAKRTTPIAGFMRAYEFEVTYTARGVNYRGLAKCHVVTSYDTAVMAMTAAISEASQWPGYSSWLPLVADQVSATSGAAFGMRGIMAQNIQNSTAYAEAAQRYREWSQKNWQAVTEQRNASQDKQNFEVRENLGGIQTYANPYDERTPLELPTTYSYFWVSPQGTVLGTNDPSVNPNVGSTQEWKQMPRVSHK